MGGEAWERAAVFLGSPGALSVLNPRSSLTARPGATYADHISLQALSSVSPKRFCHGSLLYRATRLPSAISGGKDSTALMMILAKLIPSWENVRLVALTIDEGISGYREETVRSADRLVRTLGVEHHHVTFPDLFGDSLDGILAGKESQACSICGILRKKALASAARNTGATKLATGHNLDDEAQSVLMNVLRGDLPRLVRDSSADSSGRFIPRIKPLIEVSEKEIAAYLLLHDASVDLTGMPRTPRMPFAGRCDQCLHPSNTAIRAPCPGSWRAKERSKKTAQGPLLPDSSRLPGSAATPVAGSLPLCQLKNTLGKYTEPDPDPAIRSGCE